MSLSDVPLVDPSDASNKQFYAPMPMTPRSQSSNGLLGSQAAFVDSADRYQDTPSTPGGLENKEGFDTCDVSAFSPGPCPLCGARVRRQIRLDAC